MDYLRILKEIDWTLTESTLPPRLRVERLQELAMNLWKAAFSGTPIDSLHKLPPEQIRDTWRPIRVEIEKFSNAAEIMRVADWPGTGEDLSALCREDQ
jgi:hypothetical protein